MYFARFFKFPLCVTQRTLGEGRGRWEGYGLLNLNLVFSFFTDITKLFYAYCQICENQVVPTMFLFNFLAFLAVIRCRGLDVSKVMSQKLGDNLISWSFI